MSPKLQIFPTGSCHLVCEMRIKVNCKVNSGFWGIVSIFLGLQINIWIAYYCEFTLILIVHDHALWKWILAARAWLTLPCAARAPCLAEQDSISFHADLQGIFSSAQRVRRGGRLADRISFHGACQYDDKWNLKSEIIHFDSDFHFWWMVGWGFAMIQNSLCNSL